MDMMVEKSARESFCQFDPLVTVLRWLARCKGSGKSI